MSPRLFRSAKRRLKTPRTIDVVCGCGKRAYPSKAEATKAARLTMDHLGGELVHSVSLRGGWWVACGAHEEGATMSSDIEWTDETWNPTVGCSKVSPGCGMSMSGHDGETHGDCYAIGVAHRAMQPAHAGLTIRRPGERPDWTGEVRCLPDRLDVPLKWRKPRRVFVDSMSDLFHSHVPTDFIARVFGVMMRAERHTFQVLTKRPQRMSIELGGVYYVTDPGTDTVGMARKPETWPLPNVWLGTSIESDRYTWRADHLRATPAAVRFLSLEPLLGPLPSLDLTGIDWVIVGGESGPGARPMHPEWVRDIRDQCEASGVAFFFKQWGAMVPYEPDPQPPFWASQHGDLIDGHYLPAELSQGDRVDGWWAPDLDTDAIFRWVGKKVAGRTLDGRTWDEMPAVAR